MQRFKKNDCQSAKTDMKKMVWAFILFALISCKKEKTKWITATVIQNGCYPGSWIIQLDNPDRLKEPFLCQPTQAMLSSSTTNCGNSAVVLNLPAALSRPGVQIKFSQWTDKGLLCFSSTLAPHHLQVSDVSSK